MQCTKPSRLWPLCTSTYKPCVLSDITDAILVTRTESCGPQMVVFAHRWCFWAITGSATSPAGSRRYNIHPNILAEPPSWRRFLQGLVFRCQLRQRWAIIAVVFAARNAVQRMPEERMKARRARFRNKKCPYCGCAHSQNAPQSHGKASVPPHRRPKTGKRPVQEIEVLQWAEFELRNSKHVPSDSANS